MGLINWLKQECKYFYEDEHYFHSTGGIQPTKPLEEQVLWSLPYAAASLHSQLAKPDHIKKKVLFGTHSSILTGIRPDKEYFEKNWKINIHSGVNTTGTLDAYVYKNRTGEFQERISIKFDE
jgi:hypothetical protein